MLLHEGCPPCGRKVEKTVTVRNEATVTARSGWLTRATVLYSFVRRACAVRCIPATIRDGNSTMVASYEFQRATKGLSSNENAARLAIYAKAGLGRKGFDKVRVEGLDTQGVCNVVQAMS